MRREISCAAPPARCGRGPDDPWRAGEWVCKMNKEKVLEPGDDRHETL